MDDVKRVYELVSRELAKGCDYMMFALLGNSEGQAIFAAGQYEWLTFIAANSDARGPVYQYTINDREAAQGWCAKVGFLFE